MTTTGPLPHPRPIDRGPSSVTPSDVAIDRRRPRSGHSVRVWARQSFVERRLANRLDRELKACATVLHYRVTPGSTGIIDHLVVAATGIWVIDAIHDIAAVERRRRVGPAEHVPLTIAGGDRDDLIERLSAQVVEVEQIVERIGFGWVDVHPVLCFTNADKGVRARPFEIDGVHVTWARLLVDAIATRGQLDPNEMTTIATELSSRLPAVATR